jgi:3-hydroxybutyryl-CoA dehydrogenase
MIGLHFFNPPQVMPLLEVVRAEKSDDDAVALGFEVGEALGKTTVAAGDNRGFIVNRLLVPYMLDAIRAHEQGVGSISDIDTGMMAGASHPMGPLTLADFVGLDTLVAIADVMVDAYGEERFAAPATLKKMVDAGDFGRKSGKGFYDYSGDKPVPVDAGD